MVILEQCRSVLTPVLGARGALVSPQCPAVRHLPLGLCHPRPCPCAGSQDTSQLHGGCFSSSSASPSGIVLASIKRHWHHHWLEGCEKSRAKDPQGLCCPAATTARSPGCASGICTLPDKYAFIDRTICIVQISVI